MTPRASMQRSWLWIVWPLFLTACSPDFIPIHYSRVNSAKSAKQALPLHKHAPGAFSTVIEFTRPQGFRFDPAEIEASSQGVRLRFSANRAYAILETSVGRPFAGLFEFKEATTPRHQGEIRYQISNDASRWYFYHNARWQEGLAHPNKASTAAQIQDGLVHFHDEIGGGQLFLKVFLIRKGPELLPELKTINLSGILPRTDGWN